MKKNDPSVLGLPVAAVIDQTIIVTSKVLQNWSGSQNSKEDCRLNGKDRGMYFTSVIRIGKIFHFLLQMESSHLDAGSEGVTEMQGFIHELHVQCSSFEHVAVMYQERPGGISIINPLVQEMQGSLLQDTCLTFRVCLFCFYIYFK